MSQQGKEIKTEKDRKTAQEKARKEKQKIQRSLTDKSKLQTNLDAMYSKVGTQKGGYEFESWFYELLTNNGDQIMGTGYFL